MALIPDAGIILKGETDADGNIKLTPAENELLAQAYKQSPSGTWLVFTPRIASGYK